ncbi:hypothetical protein Psuf_010050 [Phytohabitans suffuscus]|uniref:Uncharacterized protein n=2 Tax=Phytohabitans suffuscus TaxID=624315 RepID=A0A6F8YC60_9ACTN|nr:hypothetical protein Psuf_010050 [Phytohabitans suffuscus]
MSWPTFDLRALPDGGASLPNGVWTELGRVVAESIEEDLLRAGPATFRSVGFEHTASDHAQRFVDFENTVARTIVQNGLRGDGIELIIRATDLTDIRPAVVEALERIGLTYEQFVRISSIPELMVFMDDLPTRYVTNVMRSAKHRQKQQKWEPNDFIDILALPVAAVYCDIVVTEKQWAHRLRQGKVNQRYSTVLLNDTADLVQVLVNASMT